MISYFDCILIRPPNIDECADISEATDAGINITQSLCTNESYRYDVNNISFNDKYWSDLHNDIKSLNCLHLSNSKYVCTIKTPHSSEFGCKLMDFYDKIQHKNSAENEIDCYCVHLLNIQSSALLMLK